MRIRSERSGDRDRDCRGRDRRSRCRGGPRAPNRLTPVGFLRLSATSRRCSSSDTSVSVVIAPSDAAETLEILGPQPIRCSRPRFQWERGRLAGQLRTDTLLHRRRARFPGEPAHDRTGRRGGFRSCAAGGSAPLFPSAAVRIQTRAESTVVVRGTDSLRCVRRLRSSLLSAQLQGRSRTALVWKRSAAQTVIASLRAEAQVRGSMVWSGRASRGVG